MLFASSIVGLIQTVKADGAPIYIQADGSISPSNAPIHSADNITYTLTGNITANADGIVIERNNTVLNGAGYAVTGIGNGYGITLANIGNVTVTNMMITNFTDGIYLDSSSNNTIYHNNFMNNTIQVASSNSTNVWDNGVEGNYWSDYSGTDANHDGIGDTPYIIDVNNTDYFPLMGTFQCFNVTVPVQFEVDIISNCTIGQVEFVGADDVRSPTGWVTFLLLSGFVGQNGTVGFCRITLPNDLFNSTSYHVGTFLQYEYGNLAIAKVLSSNGTHTTLYFTCDLPISDPGVVIIPEFPSFLILPLFMIATLVAIIIFKKRCVRPQT